MACELQKWLFHFNVFRECVQRISLKWILIECTRIAQNPLCLFYSAAIFQMQSHTRCPIVCVSRDNTNSTYSRQSLILFVLSTHRHQCKSLEIIFDCVLALPTSNCVQNHIHKLTNKVEIIYWKTERERMSERDGTCNVFNHFGCSGCYTTTHASEFDCLLELMR